MSDVTKHDKPMTDAVENDSDRPPVAEDSQANDEPHWDDTSIDPRTLDAAKRVFERRRDLLRRLA